MTMTIRKMLLAATVLALPVAAQAQPVTGFYVGAGAGVNFKQDQDVNFNAFFVQPTSQTLSSKGASANLSYDVGVAALGSVGWGFGNGLRLEVEGNYRYNAASKATANSYSTSLHGDVSTYGVMANALFDMDVGANWIYPYIGGGVGYVWNNAGDIHAACCATPSVSGSPGSFAYQAIAGASFPIASVRGLSITAEYRFLGTSGDTSYTLSGPIVSGANVQGNLRANANVKASDQFNHAIMLGVRYAFNAAPAAVMAAPAPAATPATKSFLVFFDWDKSTLTDRAKGIIQDAAQTAKSTQHTRIDVNGYADTSGNPHYNQGLSMRRAQTVAAELVRLGVPKQEIAIKAFGDTVLLVPTGPGVREPQNRRVEIVIR